MRLTDAAAGERITGCADSHPIDVGTPVTIYVTSSITVAACLRPSLLASSVSIGNCWMCQPECQKMNNELALLLDQDDDQGAVFSDISYLAGKSHEKR